ELRNLIKEDHVYRSESETHNISKVISHTLFDLNNNCADKVLTGDFADKVSQIDANDHVKPKYKYVTINTKIANKSDSTKIDYHVEQAWSQIKSNVKIYKGLVGTKSGETKSNDFNALRTHLGYTNGRYNAQNTSSGKHEIIPIRQLNIGCNFIENPKPNEVHAYTKKVNQPSGTLKNGNFFDHGNFTYKNTSSTTSCNTNIKLVVHKEGDPSSEDDAEGENATSETTENNGFDLDGCRVITGIDYTKNDPIYIADDKAGTVKYRKKSHDAITCYEEVSDESCTHSFEPHYDELMSNDDFDQDDDTKSLAFINSSDNRDTKKLKRDLYRLRHIKERLLYDRDAPVPDNAGFNNDDTLESSPRPYSVYFPNESNSFVTVGGLVMDIDLEKGSSVKNTPIPCPNDTPTWNSHLAGNSNKNKKNKGCDSASANPSIDDKDTRKPDTKYYWDFPNGNNSRSISAVCVYFMFINVDNRNVREENKEAIAQVFGLTETETSLSTEVPSCTNSDSKDQYNAVDFCNMKRADLIKKFRERHDFFCDAQSDT
ncbi:MAG: hypothetical protein OXC44_00950, partial [Proteobacteria bacterium]|nr:hypothetical protein [Pseudomonadota bacterium]